jgi:hypothetical protein
MVAQAGLEPSVLLVMSQASYQLLYCAAMVERQPLAPSDGLPDACAWLRGSIRPCRPRTWKARHYGRASDS